MSDFYVKSSKWVNNVKPLLVNYREHLNKSREELVLNQISIKKSFENPVNSKVFKINLLNYLFIKIFVNLGVWLFTRGCH